jgi:hypothetical protein
MPEKHVFDEFHTGQAKPFGSGKVHFHPKFTSCLPDCTPMNSSDRM